MWGIAEFPGPGGRKEIAIVHRNWVNGDKCFWPPFWRNPKELEKALKKGVPADPTIWLLYEAHIVAGRYFKTYEEARSKLNPAVDGSELSSEEITERLRRQNSALNEKDTSSEESESNCTAKSSKKTFKASAHRKKQIRPSMSTLPLPPQPPTPITSQETRPALVLAESLFKEPVASPSSSLFQRSLPRALISQNEIQSSQNQESEFSDLLASPGLFETLHDNNETSVITPRPAKIDHSEAIKRIQINQELIMAKLDTVLEYLRTLTLGRQARADAEMNHPPEDLVSIPITTMEEFDRLDERIKSDSSIKTAVVDLLSRRGGNNPNQIVHRIIQYLMTDDLMVDFTFKGATGKKGFIQTNFMNCVYDAVRRHAKGSVLKDSEIEKAVEYWLKKASTRINKRKPRNGEPVPSSTADDDVEDSDA